MSLIHQRGALIAQLACLRLVW